MKGEYDAPGVTVNNALVLAEFFELTKLSCQIGEQQLSAHGGHCVE